MRAVKKPANFMRQDLKKPHGKTTGKPMALNVTVSYTYAGSHVNNMAVTSGAAADRTAQNNLNKCVWCPFVQRSPILPHCQHVAHHGYRAV